MKNNNFDSLTIKSKGRHIKTLRECGKVVAQLYEYKKIQYVINSFGTAFTRDEDNRNGINAALFPYKFDSLSLLRSCANKRKN